MQKNVVAVLIAISAVGVLGIPIGAQKFIVEAVVLESCYIALVIISIKKIRYAIIPNLVLAVIVMTGNTISSKYSEIMLSLHPLYNAIILIVGGYVLQTLLLITNILAYKKLKQVALQKI